MIKYWEGNLAKDSHLELIPFLSVAVILTGFTFFYSSTILIVFSIIAWVLVGFLLFFYRDPDRQLPADKNAIIAPADGKILSIEKVTENEFLQAPAIKISIFMSPINVHVNWIPISGQVEYYRYQKGKFLKAYVPESSAENEQTIIGINNGQVKVLFKQISGILARRIVCRVKEGDRVERGMKFGLIKLGSRVDIFLPIQIKVHAKLNQRVVGGESILGVLQNDSKN